MSYNRENRFGGGGDRYNGGDSRYNGGGGRSYGGGRDRDRGDQRGDSRYGKANWDAPSNRDNADALFGADEVSQGINFDEYDRIPVDVSGEGLMEHVDRFEDSGLHEAILDNVSRAKFTKPTPIQKYAIPYGISDRDVMACAQTGSGKTAAFLLPIIHQIMKSGLNETDPRYRRGCQPAAIVLSPTRELALQIHQQSMKFCYRTGIMAVVVYGGAPSGKQMRELREGAHLVVGTPGRLQDFIERGVVALDGVSNLVLDEADRMLDMGFEPQIRRIVEETDMPPAGDRQTMMFSATFPTEIQRLAQDFLRDYVFIAVGRVGSTTASITQKFKFVEGHQKMDELRDQIMELSDDGGLILVFVETRRDADKVERQLVEWGVNAMSIHGERKQFEREHALKMFRSGRCPVLVATDVASRGLDIPNVLYVINYDLPNNIDSYVHRIGRTGRCGNTGVAISFINNSNGSITSDLLRLLEESNQEVPTWFADLAAYGGYGSRRSGNGNFGGRDFRRGQKGTQFRRSWGGARGRGRGGGGGGGYDRERPRRDGFGGGGRDSDRAPRRGGGSNYDEDAW